MIGARSPSQRRKASKPAEIVRPDPGFQLSKQLRRLQRKAPLYALQGISELSVRLRLSTGRAPDGAGALGPFDALHPVGALAAVDGWRCDGCRGCSRSGTGSRTVSGFAERPLGGGGSQK